MMDALPSVEMIVAKCMAVGLVLRSEDGASYGHAPLSLRPAVFKRSEFDRVHEGMKIWNRVVDRMARSFDFLQSVLKPAAIVDPHFTGKLLEIHRRVYDPTKSHGAQPAMLGIFRSDYIPDENGALQHVEINTISCSFVGLGPLVALVQQYVRTAEPPQPSEAVAKRTKKDISISPSDRCTAQALAEAHRHWCRTVGWIEDKAIICFVVQHNERNIADQTIIAFRLLEEFGVRSERFTLEQLMQRMQVDAETKTATTTTSSSGVSVGISTFYLRGTYAASDFTSVAAWDVRESIERSNAIKCPSLPYHLCTMKLIQSRLTNWETLRHFCGSEEEAKKLYSTFVPQCALCDKTEEVKTAVEEAISDPSCFVLKSQVEGTGIILEGEEMARFLQIAEGAEMNSRILMRKINTATSCGFLMRNNVISQHDNLCSELGIYGAILSTGMESSEVLINEPAGWLVRTKPATSSGGGVTSGVASLDTVTFAAVDE